MKLTFWIFSSAAALVLPTFARTRPHYGGVLNVEISGDPMQSPGGLARRLILDGLTTLGADGAVRPALAVAWEKGDNAHRWQFELRPGVHFEDGSPLTSAAVVQSLNTSCNGNCPWSTVSAVGPDVVFTGDSPIPNLPALLAGDNFLISLTVAQNGQIPTTPIGTGAFQLESNTNGIVTLTANDSCWQGRPFLDSIQIHGGRTIRDQWLDLNVGRADVVQVPPQMLREARQQQFNVVVSPPVALLAIEVSSSGALSNVSLRASIAEAVDRGALFNVIFQKQGAVAASLLPQSLTGYAFLFPTDRDLGKAQTLRGGVTPPPMQLSYEGGDAVQLAAQRLALNLREAGFNVQAVPVSSAPHADLALRTLPLLTADPSAAMETLLRAAGQSIPVVDQSAAGLYQAEREFLDLHTLVPLLDLPRGYAISGRVRDFTLRTDGTPDLAAASLQDSTQDSTGAAP
ncbi:MAG: ABC transporter substrate-binding protein [Terracidiphilus sp.]